MGVLTTNETAPRQLEVERPLRQFIVYATFIP
jgi:hypothetical protein